MKKKITLLIIAVLVLSSFASFAETVSFELPKNNDDAIKYVVQHPCHSGTSH